MSAMVNLNRKNDKLSINVNPVTNVNVRNNDNPKIVNRDGVYVVEDNDVKNNDANNIRYSYTVEEYNKVANEVSVLKLIIQMMQDNPIMINEHILCDDTVLAQFVKLLTNADDVQIIAEDVDCGCTLSRQYCKVNSIYVLKDGETKNLKYNYPAVMKELNDLKICTKFVW